MELVNIYGNYIVLLDCKRYKTNKSEDQDKTGAAMKNFTSWFKKVYIHMSM